MFYILWVSLIVIFLKTTSTYTLSFVETSEDISNFTRDSEQLSLTELASIFGLSQENERDKTKDFVENAEDYNGNARDELAKVANDVFDSTYVPTTESSGDIVLPQQDETNADLERESSSQNHETEFKESSETDSPITTEQKPTHQIDFREKSEFYQSSGNGLTSSAPEDSFQEKPKVDKDDFQPPVAEAVQVSEIHLIRSEEISKFYENSENEHVSYTPEDDYHQRHRDGENDLKPSDSEATQVIEGQLIEPEEKPGYYQDSGNEHALITHEDAYQEKERADGDDLQPSDSEATQVSESQLIEPEETLSYHDRTERSFTEINEETRLNPTGKSLVLEGDSTTESKSVVEAGTGGDINERTSLAETRENFTRELAGETEIKLKEHTEAEYDFNFDEDNHLNQIGESNVRESANNIELNPTQVEAKDSLKPISQNVLNGNSYIIDEEIKKSVGREENETSHLFNSSVAKVNQDNRDGLENKLFDHVSDINSDGESELPLNLRQRANNDSKNNLSNDFELLNSEALPEEKATVKENFIPSINADMDGSSGYSEGLMVRKVDSENISGNFSFPSENDKPVERSKHLYPTHDINNQPRADISMQNNIEQLTVESSHDLIDNSEAKINERNRKEFATCETTDCVETAPTVDHENADINSKPFSNIQIRGIDSDLGSPVNSKENRNDSAHEENQSTFKYLENIGFNPHEVLQVIKTDRNLRASVLNMAILYLPVLICDILLWIVIVKLVRHIRRQITSNQQPEIAESVDVEEKESEDVDRPISARLTPHSRSRRSERDDGSEKDAGDDDFQDSSSEFLCISSKRKDWYPPN